MSLEHPDDARWGLIFYKNTAGNPHVFGATIYVFDFDFLRSPLVRWWRFQNKKIKILYGNTAGSIYSGSPRTLNARARDVNDKHLAGTPNIQMIIPG